MERRTFGEGGRAWAERSFRAAGPPIDLARLIDQPGRDDDLAEGVGDTPSRILDAAERVFARAGFDGAGMKAIATEASVAQALLRYHFGGKEALHGAVVERRSSAINAERRTALAAVDPGAPDALERVLDALLRPALGPSGAVPATRASSGRSRPTPSATRPSWPVTTTSRRGSSSPRSRARRG